MCGVAGIVYRFVQVVAVSMWVGVAVSVWEGVAVSMWVGVYGCARERESTQDRESARVCVCERGRY